MQVPVSVRKLVKEHSSTLTDNFESTSEAQEEFVESRYLPCGADLRSSKPNSEFDTSPQAEGDAWDVGEHDFNISSVRVIVDAISNCRCGKYISFLYTMYGS